MADEFEGFKKFRFKWQIIDGLGGKVSGSDIFYARKKPELWQLDEVLSNIIGSGAYPDDEDNIQFYGPEPSFDNIGNNADCGCDWKIKEIKEVK